DYRESQIPHLAQQRGHGPQEQRKVEDVCRLHQPEQSMPERSLPAFEHRWPRGQSLGLQILVLHGRLLRIQSNPNVPRRRRENSLYHPHW
ncbi:hypothetical protein PIB30_066939, partial [Stylosanthes scabra]|nr:hypothetical protein [Stylosanthes scabra]